MAEQYYYKVVGLDMCSFLNTRLKDMFLDETDDYISQFSKWKVKYKENEWTYPKVPKTKLYVFNNFYDADRFLPPWGRCLYLIFKCEIKNPCRANVVYYLNIDKFKTFWNKFNLKKKYADLTCNSELDRYSVTACDAIKLIERMPT